MISKHLYLNFTVRVLWVVASALALGWAIFGKQSLPLCIVFAVLLVSTVWRLIYYLNKINRRIFYFFDAIKNEDSMLSFPNNDSNSIIRDLTQSMEKVNRQIQQIYIDAHQQEQYFQALIEHAATGMFTFNKKGFILHSNKLARQLLGMEVLTHINQLERHDKKLFHIIKNIEPLQQHLIAFEGKKEVSQLLIKSNSFVSDNEELMLLSLHDIKNQLDEKELESWRKLIRVMMHEIMNSITPITSLSESLAGYFNTNGKIKRADEISDQTIETTLRGLEVIREQGKGLISFVESYRQLTRIPGPNKSLFRIKPMLDKLQILSETFEYGQGTELTCTVEPKGLELLADEKQISQVLINLVKNAYQANAENKDARIEIHAILNENGHPQITVTDNGPGIPQELMDKIFVPFFTTKEAGSGIGLSLSRQIMQLHGGQLKITSVPNKHTVATLTF